ncbi:hypothetical protein HPP92_015395 [Vanilla planifolia]|uniref:Uncharacterized protein n=1 Tax=Vanilla planifolia TaxID=51239 RepID=A0A835QIV6_VANPL|nr:hypothetical protein HPP92_015968 [Vanilla planifolia]KAG0475709.1 hypothetical protein HPP92_015395 [Vanilla planifolia]
MEETGTEEREMGDLPRPGATIVEKAGVFKEEEEKDDTRNGGQQRRIPRERLSGPRDSRSTRRRDIVSSTWLSSMAAATCFPSCVTPSFVFPAW